jgi:hypothetical protein
MKAFMERVIALEDEMEATGTSSSVARSMTPTPRPSSAPARATWSCALQALDRRPARAKPQVTRGDRTFDPRTKEGKTRAPNWRPRSRATGETRTPIS